VRPAPGSGTGPGRPGSSGGDHVVVVVGGVGAQDHQPRRAAPFRGGQRVADQPAAPRAEFADPFRSLVAAISGALIGVETVANALRPLIPL